MCNYLNIAYGEGHEESWNISFLDFCSSYKLSPKKVAHCFTLFDQGSIFHQIKQSTLDAKVQLLCSSTQFKRELEQASKDQAIALQTITRKYPGVFDQEISIDLDDITRISLLKFSQLIAIFNLYDEQGLIRFDYNKSDLKLIGLVPREDQYTLSDLLRNNKTYLESKQQKIASMISFATEKHQCKQKALLAYFGEKKEIDCHKCSARSCHKTAPEVDLSILTEELLKILTQKALAPHQLKLSLPQYSVKQITTAIEWLEDQQKIKRNTLDQYSAL